VANYESIQEMIEAGVTNATVIRNNVYMDEGTDTLTGVDWFTFNNNVVSNVYSNANSWLGFGTNTNCLDVNTRDSSVYYVYREEGTLWGFYKFLKIRWSGYAHYRSGPWITYDVILWDTGDISLHMVQFPSSSNTGTYLLIENDIRYPYSVSAQNTEVTFYRQEGGGWEVQNELINLRIPYERKYLIRCNNILYDIEGNELSVQTLTDTTFIDYGGDELPTTEVLNNFVNPEILYFISTENRTPYINILQVASPFPQILYSPDYDMTDPSILGIEDADIVASSDVLFAISVDGGTTWKAHNGYMWVNLSSENSGMNAETFNNIDVLDWSRIYLGASTIRMRAVIPSKTSYIESMIINFIN